MRKLVSSARSPLDWADPPYDAMADGDRAIADALSLVRLLRRLPGRPAAGPFATPAAAAAALESLGAGALDPAHLAAWWTTHAPTPPVPRRYGSRGGGGNRGKNCRCCSPWRAPPRAGWRPASSSARPAPCAARRHRPARGRGPGAHRLPADLGRLSGRRVFPARRAARPAHRVADRVAGRGRPVTWPLAFLHLVAESARMALRERDRLAAIAEKGRGVVAGGDKRSRLPDALDVLMRVPALTPKALAARLKVAPQTGTALLRVLQGGGSPGGDRQGEFPGVRHLRGSATPGSQPCQVWGQGFGSLRPLQISFVVEP